MCRLDLSPSSFFPKLRVIATRDCYATRNGVANFRDEFLLSFPRNLRRRLFDAIGNKGIIRRIILIRYQEKGITLDSGCPLAVSGRNNLQRDTQTHAEDTDGILKGGQFRGRVEPFETSCCPGVAKEGRKEGKREKRGEEWHSRSVATILESPSWLAWKVGTRSRP